MAYIDSGSRLMIRDLHGVEPLEVFVLSAMTAGYSVAPDGQGFAILEPVDTGDATPLARITVVQSWFEEFRERGRTR